MSNLDRSPLLPSSPWRRRLASIEAAAVAGMICAAGWSLSLRGLLAAPGIAATDAEIAALLFLGAALLAAPAIQVAVADKAPDPGAASLPRSAAAGVLTVVLPRVATLVMFSTASLARATGALPRWLVLLTYAVGVYELVNVTVDAPSIFLVPTWIALVSVVLLVRRPAHPFELDAATPRSV